MYIYILITPRGDQGYICILITHPRVLRELVGTGIYIYIYILYTPRVCNCSCINTVRSVKFS